MIECPSLDADQSIVERSRDPCGAPRCISSVGAGLGGVVGAGSVRLPSCPVVCACVYASVLRQCAGAVVRGRGGTQAAWYNGGVVRGRGGAQPFPYLTQPSILPSSGSGAWPRHVVGLLLSSSLLGGVVARCSCITHFRLKRPPIQNYVSLRFAHPRNLGWKACLNSASRGARSHSCELNLGWMGCLSNASRDNWSKTVGGSS